MSHVCSLAFVTTFVVTSWWSCLIITAVCSGISPRNPFIILVFAVVMVMVMVMMMRRSRAFWVNCRGTCSTKADRTHLGVCGGSTFTGCLLFWFVFWFQSFSILFCFDFFSLFFSSSFFCFCFSFALKIKFDPAYQFQVIYLPASLFFSFFFFVFLWGGAFKYSWIEATVTGSLVFPLFVVEWF